MPRVLGGQAFRPALFPPTKYIESLIRAYCPELQDAFDQERFLEAFNKARNSAFDEEFAAVSKDGVSCGLQLCWWVQPVVKVLLHMPSVSRCQSHSLLHCKHESTMIPLYIM
jgi:hypothetical protein